MNQVELPHDAPPEAVAPEYRDRSVGLILFGILEIILGSLCCLMFVGVLVFAAMPSSVGVQGMKPGMLLMAMSVYAFAGIGLIWLGIGSILFKRWARALLLIISSVWLAWGCVSLPFIGWSMMKTMSAVSFAGAGAGAGAGQAPRFETISLVVALVFLSVFFIVIPVALVLFYRSSHVKATCDVRDPNPRWTDRCPLPVLAVPCLLVVSSVWIALFPFTGMAVIPLFGILMDGLPAGVMMFALALGFLWIARSWYRAQLKGWWILFTVVVLLGASNLITFTQVDLAELYQKMGYTQQLIDTIRSQGMMNGNFVVWMSLLWMVPALSYLFWVKRYFR